MAGATAPTAELLAFDTVDSYSMGGDSEVWYRLEPSVTGSYRFKVNGVAGSNHAYCDVYRVTATIVDPYPYTDPWVGWIGDDPQQNQEACIELLAGEVYLVACYEWSGGTSGDFTIEVDADVGPSNDRVVNATVLAGGKTVISGTTVGASEEEGDEADSGNQSGSVWYKAIAGGPGAFWYQIESTTPGWHPSVEIYYPTGGPVSGFGDLTYDSGQDAGDGTESPPLKFYDQILPGGDLAPIEGGEVFYLRVISYEQTDSMDKGSFVLTVFIPPDSVCLNAADYLGSSSTASIVSGAVRESQVPNFSWGSLPVRPWEGWMGDLEDTLSIPGADIADSPGFYSVTIKTKNSTQANWVVGLKRNGQPLWPGAEIDSGQTTTPYMDYVTMPAGSIHPNELDMTKYLPVKPGDTIEVIVALNAAGGSTIDITEICFQRILSAVDGVAYDVLDVPDYPLGTTSGDMNTNAQQGDLVVGKDTAPTFTGHRIYGLDMCVTDDGTVWVAHNQHNAAASSGTRTGPVLHYWNGTSWTLVSDDIEGLGVKRTPSSAIMEPYGLSMDTDGEDIWICYQIDDGNWTNPVTGATSQNKSKIRVKKYDVSAGTFSNVGSPIGPPLPHGNTYNYVGHYEDVPTIRVSPNGVPWVGFVNYNDHEIYAWAGQARVAYVARWTGSTWDIHEFGGPVGYSDFQDTTDWSDYEAETYINGSSPTASTTTYSGVSCVQETQTTYANDTIRFTPPAGKWSFALKYQWAAGTQTGIKAKFYKDNVAITPQTDDISVGGGSTATTNWAGHATSTFYTECDGSQEIEIRVRRYSATGGTVYVDRVVMLPAEHAIEMWGYGPIDVCFVEDGQPHVALWMHQVGDVGLGENPAALFQCAWVKPEITDPAANGYVPPDQYIGSYAWAYQEYVYFEWDGDSWVRVWSRLIEEDAPNHVYVRTIIDGIASTPPVGHFQQGMGFTTDGTDNYLTVNLGGGQAFGFFPDQIVALKIGPAGFIPFTEGPPGCLTSYGYPQWDDGDGGVGQYSWGWDTAGRSICVDQNGNVWLGFSSVGGAPAEYTSVITHAAKNGIGDWFVAALTNEEFGYDDYDCATPAMCMSPDGTKLYILWDTFIYSDGIAPNNPYTFGVWECDVIEDAKIPLILSGAIDLARLKFRSFYIGDS